MNVGFISTRLAGTDGVSLETAKFASICRRLGHNVFYCAGELDSDARPGMVVPDMHFTSKEARWIHDQCFGTMAPGDDLRPRISAMTRMLKQQVSVFVDSFEIDVLVTQNALTIPMHVPLGLALADFIEETGIRVVNHNHDFYWERERFRVNCIPDLLERAYPPALPSVRHLVINSIAQTSLRERLGLASEIMPNIFDFSSAAPGITDRNHDLRSQLGLTDDHLFVLQPTRVVERKAIERAIDFVRLLRLPEFRTRLQGKEATLVLTHHAGDEGMEYLYDLQTLAREADVPLIYAAERFAHQPGQRDGVKIFSLWDAYVHADFVTYPSEIEGFGNALLEAIYFRLPILVNRYPVYVTDIAPKGFDMLEIDQFITTSAVEASIEAIVDPVRRRRMVERNYALGHQHFSFEAATNLVAESLAG